MSVRSHERGRRRGRAMTATALLHEFRRLGVRLRADGARIIARPLSAVPPELRAAARTHETQLLRLLTQSLVEPAATEPAATTDVPSLASQTADEALTALHRLKATHCPSAGYRLFASCRSVCGALLPLPRYLGSTASFRGQTAPPWGPLGPRADHRNRDCNRQLSRRVARRKAGLEIAGAKTCGQFQHRLVNCCGA
jgi:hypothetical protein